MRHLSVAAGACVMLFAMPLIAVASEEVPEYTGAQFVALYEYAVANTLPNLEEPNGRYEITGDNDLDDRIWELAFERGYVLRPDAGPDMGRADGVVMQFPATDAWLGLKAEARAAGMRFILSSAYRSPQSQRTQFLSKLEGTSDDAIEAALSWWSVPGTSKHHGGYALDFRYRDGTFGEFRSTPDYDWLNEDNFAVPKSHGLVPSYPDDVSQLGPNPEPWEFVWVGTGLIQCGLPQVVPALLGPAAGLSADIGRCPGGMTPASIPDWLDF